MPPRRGPDTRPPTGPSTRINEAIRAETVRLIDAEGENRGVVPLAEAQEIKFRPKIDPHDYVTKKGHVERFLRHRDKVKITIMFRGRELLHPERGEAILLRLADELKDLALVESRPNLDGRNMVMMLAPLKNPTPTAVGGGPSEGDAAGEPTEPTEAEPAPESTPAVVGGGPSKGDEPPEPAEAAPPPE